MTTVLAILVFRLPKKVLYIARSLRSAYRWHSGRVELSALCGILSALR
jgi:hypothetical protein